jgi:accessory gene regulator protein AgrB
MAILFGLFVVALAGIAAYAYLRANHVGTHGEERLAIVLGFAFALLLSESPREFAAQLVVLGSVVLGLASIAHLAVVTVRDGRVTVVPG